MFITFEGLDYAGKSTQVKLLFDHLSHERFNVLLLREPGGTEIGEKIRAILLDKGTLGMTDTSEMFLFSASRSQLVEEVIKPALEGGMIVVCDRFYDSTTAYQGWGRGIPLEAVKAINMTATGGLVPDVTVFIDVPVGDVEKRMRRNAAGQDRMELNGREFYERVRKGYLELAKSERRFVVVNGAQSVEAVQEEIWNQVEQRVLKGAKQRSTP